MEFGFKMMPQTGGFYPNSNQFFGAQTCIVFVNDLLLRRRDDDDDDLVVADIDAADNCKFIHLTGEILTRLTCDK